MNREEILVVTRNFPPLVGGMERLMEHAVAQLSKRYSCTLIGPRGCEQFSPPQTLVRSCRVAPLPIFLLEAMFRSMTTGNGGKYRFALAGSGLTAPMAGMVKLIHRIPAISFVHGLDLIAEDRVYQRLFLPWLRYMDLVIANSRNTARLAESKGVSPDKIRILHPGVNLPEHQRGKDTDFLARHDLIGKKVLLSVGRLIPRKGLAEFLQNSFPTIVAACPETVLLIIGTEPDNSLKRVDGTRSGIKQVVEAQGLSNHLRFLGNVDDRTLSLAYSAADLFIFPVLDLPGDVEGFGMVAIEAAAHGLPTLAFAAGGVPDAVNDGYTGILVECGNYRGFAEAAIRHLTEKSPLVTEANCREFASHFEWQRFGAELFKICSTVSY